MKVPFTTAFLSLTSKTKHRSHCCSRTSVRMAGGNGATTKSRKLFSFDEARRIARGHGFDSKEEFLEYTCPGAYQIPKDADVVWTEVR